MLCLCSHGIYFGDCSRHYVNKRDDLRNPSCSFKAAVDTLPKTTLVGPISSGPAALLIMAFGNLLVLSSMWKLGVTGTYLGDHFGITLKEKIVGFPFNFLEHPMYDGASMIFAGYALWYII